MVWYGIFLHRDSAHQHIPLKNQTDAWCQVIAGDTIIMCCLRYRLKVHYRFLILHWSTPLSALTFLVLTLHWAISVLFLEAAVLLIID